MDHDFDYHGPFLNVKLDECDKFYNVYQVHLLSYLIAKVSFF